MESNVEEPRKLTKKEENLLKQLIREQERVMARQRKSYPYSVGKNGRRGWGIR